MCPIFLQSKYKTAAFIRKIQVGDLRSSIKESEIISFVKNDTVNQFYIVQTTNETYNIVVTIISKTEELNLITTRGRKREWVSLDRLSRHIREVYQWGDNPIGLYLRSQKR